MSKALLRVAPVALYGVSASVLIAVLVAGCNTGRLVSGDFGWPNPGETIFNDPSSIPDDNVPDDATMVGADVCKICHSAPSHGHPAGLYAEWQQMGHAVDPSTLIGGTFFTRTVADGNWPGTPCAVCHVTGGPDSRDHPGTSGGYDTSEAFDTPHNKQFWSVQCEACHGAGSAHVAAGGDKNLINRVPDATKTCQNCHANMPNEKGNRPTGPVDDATMALYSTSMQRQHNPGVLITGTNGYEYAGKTYDHSPHRFISNSCQTCHMFRMPNEVVRDHTNVHPRKEACAFCHGGAANASEIGEIVVNEHGGTLHELQEEIKALLVQLGGADANGNPLVNFSGGLMKAYLDGGGLATDDKYIRARWNYCLVRNDTSLGAHDFEYARDLLETTIEDIQTP